MHFTDQMIIDEAPRKTADGYAVISARVARGDNIQLYLGKELGIDDMEVVRVFRPSEEVFRRDAIQSYAGVPVTFGHPSGKVTAETWKDLAVGEVGEDVLRDGEFVRVPMMLRDAAAIAKVDAGVRELSMGYDAKVQVKAGRAPNGEVYDAVMTDFKMNHVAIVDRARGGDQLRIGDAKDWGLTPIQDEKGKRMNLKTVTVDGIPIEVTDQGATVIATLMSRVSDVQSKLEAANTAHVAALAAKDADIAKKDAEIDALKGKVLDAAAIDALVAGRAQLVTLARKIAGDIKLDGMSDADIRKTVVHAKLGDAAVKDKTQAYVDARFDILAEDAAKADTSTNNDPFARTVLSGVQTTDAASNVAAAHKAMTDGLTSAWQNSTKGNA